MHYSFSRSKYFHLLIAPIEGFISNWIMRMIDVIPPYYFYWFRIDSNHMTEPWLDQALMDPAYRSGVLTTCSYPFFYIADDYYPSLDSQYLGYKKIWSNRPIFYLSNWSFLGFSKWFLTFLDTLLEILKMTWKVGV